MAEVDFSDFDAAKAWFEEQSAQTRSLFASRSALRVLANVGRYSGQTHQGLALPCFRAILISAVRGIGRTADMEAAARFAARSAALSADSARSAALSADSAAQGDLERFMKREAAGALWPPEFVPLAIAENHERFLQILDGNSDWSFWRNWYAAMWEGTFEDWDLAHEVAKIEDEVWEGEDALAKVAAEIERISDELIANRLPQAEIIFEDEEGLYDVRSAFADPSKLTGSVLSRVSFAFQTAIDSNSCDLNGLSLPAKIIKHIF